MFDVSSFKGWFGGGFFVFEPWLNLKFNVIIYIIFLFLFVNVWRIIFKGLARRCGWPAGRHKPCQITAPPLRQIHDDLYLYFSNTNNIHERQIHDDLYLYFSNTNNIYDRQIQDNVDLYFSNTINDHRGQGCIDFVFWWITKKDCSVIIRTTIPADLCKEGNSVFAKNMGDSPGPACCKDDGWVRIWSGSSS